MRRRSASPSTGSDTNKHVGSRRCTQGRAREACEAEMMRGATWRTHSLRVAIAGLLTRFDRVTSLTHPAPQRSAPVEGGPAGTCPFRAGLVPLWRLPLWKLPLWKLPLWGLPSWGRPWPNLKATRGQGGFGHRRLRTQAASVKGGLGQGHLGGSNACWTLACQPPGTVGVGSIFAAAGTGAGAEACGLTFEAHREPAQVDGALITPCPYTGLRIFNCSLLTSCANMRRLSSTGSSPASPPPPNHFPCKRRQQPP